jgi:dolichyl-phosphate beta-glucosyltransferase
MRSIGLSVVIPAYNERRRLAQTLGRVLASLERRPDGFEVLVVDDGSTDGTAAVAAQLLAPLGGRGRVLRNVANAGKGASVRRGMLSARGRRVLYSDADFSTPIEEVEKLERALDDGAGVAFGSRAVDRRLLEVRQSRPRELMGRLFNVVVRLCAVTGVRDTQCGFKLFAGAMVVPVFSRARLDRFGFDVELIALALALGATIKEIPVRWRNSPDTRVTLWQGAKAFADPLRVRANFALRRYRLAPQRVFHRHPLPLASRTR